MVIMAYIKNSSYHNLLKIENGQIKDYSSGQIKYFIRGDRLTDFGGRILLNVTTDTVKTFGGQIIAKFDSSTIKNFSGMIQYRIDGFLSRSEMMALIAIIYAI